MLPTGPFSLQLAWPRVGYFFGLWSCHSLWSPPDPLTWVGSAHVPSLVAQSHLLRTGSIPPINAFLLEQIGKARSSAPENEGAVGEGGGSVGVQAGGGGPHESGGERLTRCPPPPGHGGVCPPGVHAEQGALGPRVPGPQSPTGCVPGSRCA